MHHARRAMLRRLFLLPALLFAFASHARPSTALPDAAPCRFSVSDVDDTVIEITAVAPDDPAYRWTAAPTRDIARLSEGIRAGDAAERRAGQPVIQWWRFDITSAWARRPVIDFFLYRQREGRKAAVRHCVVDSEMTQKAHQAATLNP